MQSILRISDAAAIALHAADYLAAPKSPLVPAMEITRALDISYNHLSKVLQQLTKAGLLVTARGPKGGFALSAAGKKARVRDFIAAIDGPPATRACMLKHKVCLHRDCVLGNFLSETNERFKTVLDRKITEFREK